MPNPLPDADGAAVVSPLPRVLVADDDPGSCRFLCDGLRRLGTDAQACGDGTSALALARAETFDLLLLDCRMPGAGALEILTQLRRDEAAGSALSIAVATTAELDPVDRRQLLEAGFSEILLKPCSIDDLRRMLTLLCIDHGHSLVLDDDAALSASGDTTTMRALRGLLRDELEALQHELDRALEDGSGFSDRLHRLRSSCGFCGAAALSAQTIALQRQLSLQRVSSASMARFRHTLRTTLQALQT